MRARSNGCVEAMATKGGRLMVYEKFGSDNAQIASFGGGVISEDGNVLLSGNAESGQALLFGPAAIREIQAGVANGDFALGPQDPLAAITAENNPLPYWTYASNLTGISAAIATASTAAQQALTFTAAASGAVGSSITLTRYVPIAGNANRNQAYQPEVYVLTGTGTSGDRGRVRLTLTATAVDANFSALTATATNFDTAFNLSNKSLTTDWFTPDATAAFILLTLVVSIPTTAPAAAVTMPITEVRLNVGVSTIAFPNATNPAHSPWIVESLDEASIDTFRIYNAASTKTEPALLLEYDESALTNSATLNAETGTINIFSGVGGVVEITGDTIYATSGTTGTAGSGTINAAGINAASTTTSDLLLRATGADFIFQDTNAADGTNPRLLFRDKSGTYYAGVKSGAANVIQILNGTSTTDYAQVWAERFYPMNGSTASRYIFDNGTQTAFSGPVLAGAGTFQGAVSADNYSADNITGTTATTNAAIWVLTAGTTYNLRRNTSSARYKTNIVDADDAVLAAAKKIQPRHYESTIADEAGATRLGFIAEEVEAAGLTHAVGYDAEGRVDTIDPTALIAALYARVNDLERRLSELEK